MKKKIIKKSEIKNLVNEAVENVIEKINNLNEKNVYSGINTPILEMAKLNLKDNEMSIFPANRYRIWVQGDNSPHKPPHLHIKDKQDEWEIKYFIESGEIWEVINPGKVGTKNPDAFRNVTKKIKEWFSLPTKMPGRVGTNQETALNEWEACNED